MVHYTRLERLAKDKCSNLFGRFVSYEEIEALWILPLGQYSLDFIFIIAYKCAKESRVLYNTILERLASDKNSNLLGQFTNHKEIEVLWISLLGPYSQHFIFVVTYKWAKESKWLHNTGLERLASDKHSNLLGQFASHKEIEVLWLSPVGNNPKSSFSL